uniref:Transmembrane and tetratricopeptide repeat containing 4 n=1 Tax=Mus musculus TaxID=10090 RepID=D6RH66_MOUSE
MVELDADLDHIVPSVLPPFWAKTSSQTRPLGTCGTMTSGAVN